MAYLGEEIPKLGFGLMRLPKNGDHSDVEQTKKMVDRFMEEGFTYFDTAWAYGDSEATIKEALVDRYPRESYQLATKLAAWLNCKTKEEAEAQLAESLNNTGAGYFDFYLLHNLGEHRTKYFDEYDLWTFVRKKKEEGLIRHIGFSFHSTPEELEPILQAHPEAEFVQLQINYGDWENPAVRSRECYEMCRKYDKPVIVMEPVKGGMLATPPESVAELFRKAEPDASYASWAIRFAADLEGVITVLSGMSDLEQMEDNLAVMKSFTHLSGPEKAVLDEARKAMAEIPLIPCTTCHYCAKVCPMDIGISGSFIAMNNYTLYRNMEGAKRDLYWGVEGHGHKYASACIKCGACEDACPQHISIRDELDRVTGVFAL